MKIKVKDTSVQSRSRTLCDQYMVQVEDKIPKTPQKLLCSQGITQTLMITEQKTITEYVSPWSGGGGVCKLGLKISSTQKIVTAQK